MANLKFGSLFAGVGGFDLGFENAGWKCEWQVEWDAKCASVLDRHWPEVQRYDDVSSVSHLNPVDLVTFGFPCQDLSVASTHRAGLDGKRSGLFFEAIRIIEEMRNDTDGRYPTFAVAENVPGLLSADKGDAMGRVLDALAEIGAVGIEWAMLDAQHFGLSQRRKRMFIVACFDPGAVGVESLLPVSEGCPGSDKSVGKEGAKTPRVVAACLNSGGNSGGFRTEPGEHLVPVAKIIRSGARDAAGNLPPEVWEQVKVSPTLNQFDNGSESRATVLVYDDRLPTDYGVRRLTPRECERLQGFPDDWTRWAASGKEIPDTSRYKMMGNAVAVPVAEWVARQLAKQIQK